MVSANYGPDIHLQGNQRTMNNNKQRYTPAILAARRCANHDTDIALPSGAAPAALLLGALAAAVTGAARAEDTDTLSLGDIVITATRTAMDISDAPAAVSVVTDKDIERQGTVHLVDALKNLPGVLVRDNSGNPSAWSQQVIMRGVAGYNRNAVLVDGQSLNNAFSAGANWSMIDPNAVARVEVVRGPFSSLYGGSAMGGVVNIITKRPVGREVTAKAGVGSNNLRYGYASYANRLNDKVGLRLEAGQKAGDGYVQDLVVKTPSTGTGTAVDGLQPTQTTAGSTAYIVGDKGKTPWWQQNAGLTLDLATDPDTTITLGLRYHRHQNSFDAYNTYLTDASTGVPIVSGSAAVNGTQRVTLRESDFLFGANGEEVTRLTAAYERKLDGGANLKLDALYTVNGYWYITPTSGTATASGGSGKFVDIPTDRLSTNATYGLALNDTHFLVSGAAFTRSTLAKRESIISDWRDRDSTVTARNTFVADGENATYAVYLQDEVTLAPSLTAYLGARYDHWTTHGSYAQVITPVFQGDYAKRSKSALSPKLSLVYTPGAHTTLRASAGSAFREPTLSDMYSTWSSSSGTIYFSNPDLKPETITSYEIGGEHRLSAATRLTATIFHNEITDMIASDRLNDGTSNRIQVNIGKAESRGFEMELRHRFDSAVTGFVNYTLTNSKILENPSAPTTVGKRLTLIPERAANIGLELQRGPLSGYLAARYVGKMYGNSSNTDVVNNVYGSYDPYTVVDAKLGYRLGDTFSVSLSVFNLLDRRYYLNSIAPRRTVLAEVTANF